ncbi:Rv1678 family membrane protein [Actinomadura madurae]|uniref:Rv1678 family membrane protein n=1 Tax=Actinomadura madurae TaxID=1993 RepID=UPI003FD7C3AE
MIIAAVLGVAAVVAGALGLRNAAVAVGAAFMAAAVVVPVESSLGEKWIGGTGSTFSLWLGLGVGLMSAGLVRRTAEDARQGS